ncbi:MAG TPA: hypothetical protein VIH09_04235 [Flavobacterium sp.]|uniref:hypothetical protein n=1 Tax=Flavobacterium sp. TaxID=239 RepID=UPI002F412A73
MKFISNRHESRNLSAMENAAEQKEDAEMAKAKISVQHDLRYKMFSILRAFFEALNQQNVNNLTP